MDFEKLLSFKGYMKILKWFQWLNVWSYILKKEWSISLVVVQGNIWHLITLHDFYAKLFAFTSFTLTKRIRGFISCFWLGFTCSCKFKSFVVAFFCRMFVLEKFYIKCLKLKRHKYMNTILMRVHEFAFPLLQKTIFEKAKI